MTKKQKQRIEGEAAYFRMGAIRVLYGYIGNGEVVLTRYKPSHYVAKEYAILRYAEIIEVVKTKGGK